MKVAFASTFVHVIPIRDLLRLHFSQRRRDDGGQLQGDRRGVRGTEELRQQVLLEQDSRKGADRRQQRSTARRPLQTCQNICKCKRVAITM